MTGQGEILGDVEALTFEVELDAPPAKVWRAVTVPDYVRQWLGSEVRASAQEPRAPKPALSLRLIEAEPQRYIRYRWIEDGSPDQDSIVTFALAPNGTGGTSFRIVHEVRRAKVAAPAPVAANCNLLMQLAA